MADTISNLEHIIPKTCEIKFYQKNQIEIYGVKKGKQYDDYLWTSEM